MQTPATAAKDLVVRYVGFWRRVLASLVDTVLLVIVTAPMLYSVYGPEYFTSEELLHGAGDLLISYVFPAVAVIAFWFARSATPGKMLIGAKIVDAETLEKPRPWQFVGRYFAYIPAMLPLLIGIFWVAVDKRKQGWHDKLAGTVVIQEYK